MSFFRRSNDITEQCHSDEIENSSAEAIQNLLANYNAETLSTIIADVDLQIKFEESLQSIPLSELYNIINETDMGVGIFEDAFPHLRITDNTGSQLSNTPRDDVNRNTNVAQKNKPSVKKKFPDRPERNSINKPPPLEKVNDTDPVSIEDGTILTDAEKETIMPAIKGYHLFYRNKKYIKVVNYSKWLHECIWVHAQPVAYQNSMYMVYVDPKDYPRLVKFAKRMIIDGRERRNLYCYGEPPVYVCRYGAYRKLYDPQNIIKPPKIKKRALPQEILTTEDVKNDKHKNDNQQKQERGGMMPSF